MVYRQIAGLGILAQPLTSYLSLGWFLNLFVPLLHQWSNNGTSHGVVLRIK